MQKIVVIKRTQIFLSEIFEDSVENSPFSFSLKLALIISLAALHFPALRKAKSYRKKQ